MFIETLEHIAETYVNFPTYFVGAGLTIIFVYFLRRILAHYEHKVKRAYELEDAENSFFLSLMCGVFWPAVISIATIVFLFNIVEWSASFLVARFTKQ